VYPESSIITENKFIGCAVATTQPGDIVFVALGCTYPMVLRPDETGKYVIRGFAYVCGVMDGELADSEGRIVQIQ
jgi:hypothetical protein